MNNQTVLYHANCYDGFCAAWVLHKWYWPDASYVPISYSDPVPWEKIGGHDVIVADFSFKRPVMLEVAERAKTIKVLDHHKTAEAELEGLDFCVFDMEKSGGRLAWEFALEKMKGVTQYRKDGAPQLVLYTEDRDLWLWKLPSSKDINMAIRSHPMDWETWDRLEMRLQTQINSVAEEGEAIYRFQDQYIDAMRKFTRMCRLDTQTGHVELQVVNAPYFSISDLLNAICEDEQAAGRTPMAMAWFQRSDGLYQYSLRSIGDVDVSEIAKRFGGGGHKNAAGFESKDIVFRHR